MLLSWKTTVPPISKVLISNRAPMSHSSLRFRAWGCSRFHKSDSFFASLGGELGFFAGMLHPPFRNLPTGLEEIVQFSIVTATTKVRKRRQRCHNNKKSPTLVEVGPQSTGVLWLGQIALARRHVLTFPAKEKIGMYIAMSMPPRINATKTNITGSIIWVIAATASSTSSS